MKSRLTTLIRSSLLLFLAATLALSCAEDDSGSASGAEAPSAWSGDEPHLAAVGSIEGEDVAFFLEGSEAVNVNRFFCERNYVVPSLDDQSDWANDGYLEKIEVKWLVVVEGSEREYQLELLQHDFGASEDGDTIAVVAFDEDSTERAPETIMAGFGWQYEEDGNEVEIEALSETGSFVRGTLTGEIDPDNGLVIPDGEGSLGGYLHLEWDNGDRLDLDFTANCGDNDLDIP